MTARQQDNNGAGYPGVVGHNYVHKFAPELQGSPSKHIYPKGCVKAMNTQTPKQNHLDNESKDA